MTRRLTFLARFHQHGKPYEIKASHITEAHKQANWLAAKYGWTLASVGLK